MNLSKSTLILAITTALALSALPAQSRERHAGAQPSHPGFGHRHHGEHRPNRPDVVKHETTRQNTDNGFKRNTVLTNAQGQTATRQVEVIHNKATGTSTRTMTGTTFDGKAISGQSVTTRTEDGYTRQDRFTGPAGQTSTRDVDVSHDGNTVTKTVTTTNPQGQTHTHTGSHPVQGGGLH